MFLSHQTQGLAVNTCRPTAAMTLLESLKAYLEEIRDKFSKYELKAIAMCPDSDYSVVNRPKHVGLQMRSVGLHLARYDRPEKVILHKSDKFKVETFLPVLDFLSSGLKSVQKLIHGLEIWVSITGIENDILKTIDLKPIKNQLTGKNSKTFYVD